MVSPPPVSLQLSNSVAFRQLLASCGKLLESNSVGPPPTKSEVFEAAIRLYDAGIEDPAVQPAAFGMAVAVISTNLDIGVRTAALVLATLLDTRGK